ESTTYTILSLIPANPSTYTILGFFVLVLTVLLVSIIIHMKKKNRVQPNIQQGVLPPEEVPFGDMPRGGIPHHEDISLGDVVPTVQAPETYLTYQPPREKAPSQMVTFSLPSHMVTGNIFELEEDYLAPIEGEYEEFGSSPIYSNTHSNVILFR
ncbi:unnamed protein product, partial [Meganyctiphanes norvegica]